MIPRYHIDLFRWLYALLLAEDANFKQKSRLRPGKHDEEALGPGWGTFVSNKPYLNYVSQFANQEEVGILWFTTLLAHSNVGVRSRIV